MRAGWPAALRRREAGPVGSVGALRWVSMPPGCLTRVSPFAYACAACNRCCHHYAIKVNPYEAWRLARRLGLSTSEFAARHLANGPTLRRTAAGACEFLGPQGCTVHPDRPLVCRLYPLSRHVAADGSETFATMTPHPQSEGTYGGPGTVGDYLASQGAEPFLVAVDRYLDVFRRMHAALERRLGDDDELRRTARSTGERQLGAVPAGLLDVDDMVGQYCRSRDLPLPTTPGAVLDLHIAALEAWANGIQPESEPT